MKHIELYAKEDPTTTQRRLFFSHNNDSVCQTLAKVFKTFGNSKHVEKLMVSALSMYCLNPCIKMYDILMREYIKREFEVVVQDIEEKWKERCWNCEKVDANSTLKCCSVCKLAKYCSMECQKREWKVHKVLHMELDNLIAVALH